MVVDVTDFRPNCGGGVASGLLPERPMHRDLPRDIHYPLRSLARTPVWTATLVLTIALGIGSAAAVQGFVRGLLSIDLPILAIDRVVTVFATDAADATGPAISSISTAPRVSGAVRR